MARLPTLQYYGYYFDKLQSFRRTAKQSGRMAIFHRRTDSDYSLLPYIT